MNPLKIVWNGLKVGGKGMKIAYRQATRPEVMAVLRIGGMFFPPINAIGVLRFMTLAKQAESIIGGSGTGKAKMMWVLRQAMEMKPEIERLGVPRAEWVEYIESALLLIDGKASLVSDVDGTELLEEDLDRLAALFDAPEKECPRRCL